MTSLPMGHGWVRPLPNRSVERCGGPGICSDCGNELLHLTRAVKELFYWQVSDLRNFHSFLYYCVAKADWHNRIRLGMGFPWEVAAFEMWERAPSEWEFFAKYGFKREARSPQRPEPKQ